MHPDPTDAQILEAAKRATPGPYSRIPQSRRVTDATGATLVYTTVSPEQSAYLAMLSPSVVTRLIERAQAAEKRVAELEAQLALIEGFNVPALLNRIAELETPRTATSAGTLEIPWPPTK